MIRAVFGGSFDPVHRGHEMAVQAIRDHQLAGMIHIVPAWLSPHKSGFSASPEDRRAMVEVVFSGSDATALEWLEMDSGTAVYTCDTLAELSRRYPNDSLRIVMGADQLSAFGKWHRPERILELAEPILLARQAGDLEELCRRAGIDPAKCHLLPDFDQRVSATEIRANLADDAFVQKWLHPRVLEYIRQRGLYHT